MELLTVNRPDRANSSMPAASPYYMRHPGRWEALQAKLARREEREAADDRFNEAPEYNDDESIEIGRCLVLGLPLPKVWRVEHTPWTVSRNADGTTTITGSTWRQREVDQELSEFRRLACISAYRRHVLRVDGCCGRTPDENGNCPLLNCQCRRYAAAYFGGWGRERDAIDRVDSETGVAAGNRPL